MTGKPTPTPARFSYRRKLRLVAAALACSAISAIAVGSQGLQAIAGEADAIPVLAALVLLVAACVATTVYCVSVARSLLDELDRLRDYTAQLGRRPGGEREATRSGDEVTDLAHELAQLAGTIELRHRHFQVVLERERDRRDRDPLTWLHDKRSFNERLAELTTPAHRAHGCTLVMVDLDDFKQINDRHGHPEGDRVLCEVANALRTSVGAGEGRVFRVGGEEFAVLLRGEQPDRAAQIVQGAAERLRARGGVGQDPVTFSAGIASFPQDAAGSRGLYEIADARLYEAKRLGKDAVVSAGESFGLSRSAA